MFRNAAGVRDRDPAYVGGRLVRVQTREQHAAGTRIIALR
jgi:hypothetical protein